MNYKKVYAKIIDNAKTRKRDENEYYEIHHIVPKCMGGDDFDENLVFLTAREHYIAHQLLCKIHPNNTKIILAAMMMCVDSEYRDGRNENRLYEWVRKQFSKNHPSKTDSGKEKIKLGLSKYYLSEKWEEKKQILQSEKKEHRTCMCGCGEQFLVSKKSKKKYINHSHSAKASTGKKRDKKYNEKTSESMKKYLESLTKDEMSDRMKKSLGVTNHTKRGKNISKGKKGKKTNQQEIMGRKYALLSDEDFDDFIKTKSPRVRNRMIKLRDKWKNK